MERISISDKCTTCIHYAMCKYSDDYVEFANRVYDLASKLDGEIIAEDVAQVKITCKHYTKHYSPINGPCVKSQISSGSSTLDSL